ncbi:MAG: DASH family cryptochrome [Flavobacteriales bacterium]
MKKRAILLWFRNDLRVHDNETLVRACNDSDLVIPVFCLDTNVLNGVQFGIPRIGSRRLAFLLESVADLKKSLQLLGGDLLVKIGKPVDAIRDLAVEYNVQAVYCSAEFTSEEIEQERSLESELHHHGIPLKKYWASTLLHPQDLPFAISNIPDIFTSFRNKVENKFHYREVYETPIKISTPNFNTNIPSIAELGFPSFETESRAAFNLAGGETTALKHLENYIWKDQHISTYKLTRNGMVGMGYSGKFSPWLANGSLSARQITTEVNRFENEVEKNESTYWMIFELLWRDFFKFTFLKYGNNLFQLNGNKTARQPWNRDLTIFENWKSGQTGDDFVNANMIELNGSGWMSNRGRQNVASYLVHDLGIDWRWGAAYFEQQLIDYDPSSNWGNWAYVAGVGNDPRPFRKFNTQKQANDYDKDSTFRKLWLK